MSDSESSDQGIKTSRHADLTLYQASSGFFTAATRNTDAPGTMSQKRSNPFDVLPPPPPKRVSLFGPVTRELSDGSRPSLREPSACPEPSLQPPPGPASGPVRRRSPVIDAGRRKQMEEYVQTGGIDFNTDNLDDDERFAGRPSYGPWAATKSNTCPVGQDSKSAQCHPAGHSKSKQFHPASHRDKETGDLEVFQSISARRGHRGVSFEEIRLVDYGFGKIRDGTYRSNKRKFSGKSTVLSFNSSSSCFLPSSTSESDAEERSSNVASNSSLSHSYRVFSDQMKPLVQKIEEVECETLVLGAKLEAAIQNLEEALQRKKDLQHAVDKLGADFLNGVRDGPTN